MRSILKRFVIFGLILLGLLVVAAIVIMLLEPRREIQPPPLSQLREQQKAELLSYLQHTGLPPEDYIISKFKQYDVIMLGEYHRVRHDPLFVQRLIPILYRNGIHLLGFEFSLPEDQERIDQLISAKEYDESLAIDILRNFGGIWPFRQYLDVFKAAWSVNSTLPPNAERFRILALTPRVDWEKANYGTEQEQLIQKQLANTMDSVSAIIVEREAFQNGKKILVYCGRHHAFSKFRQPAWDEYSSEFLGRYAEGRAGQRLHRKYPDKVITVMLNAPNWYPACQTWGLPFGGVIDRIFRMYQKPVGFDVPGSPFGNLIDSSSVFSLGYGKIRCSDFCDGYIVLDQIKNYQGPTLIDGWLNGVSFSDFTKRLPKKVPWFVLHPSIFMWVIKDDADIAKRFRALPLELEERQK
jgi:hypothetical protein